MTRGLHIRDLEVVETRWRLHRASFRYQWQHGARLYLTGSACVATLQDWTHCDACRPLVLALRAVEAGRHER